MLTHGIEVQVVLGLSVHEKVGLRFRGSAYLSLDGIVLSFSGGAVVFRMQLGWAQAFLHLYALVALTIHT